MLFYEEILGDIGYKREICQNFSKAKFCKLKSSVEPI